MRILRCEIEIANNNASAMLVSYSGLQWSLAMPLTVKYAVVILLLGMFSFTVSIAQFLMQNKLEVWTIAGFAIAFFLFVISERVTALFDIANSARQRQERTNQVLGKLGFIESHLRKNTDLRYVGSSSDVLDEIENELRSVSCVKNTLVGIGRHSGYTAAVKQLYETFFLSNHDSKWFDLTSFNEIFDDRFQMDLDHEIVRDRHVIGVLRHHVPLMNFTLLYRGDKIYRLYMGWNYRSHSSQSPIFAGSSDRVLYHYERYFNYLWEHKLLRSDPLPLRYDVTTNRRVASLEIVDKTGVWITGAFDADHGTGSAPGSFGISEIILLSGKINFSGRVFDNERREIRRITPVNVYYSTNHIHFEYSYAAAHVGNAGFLFYRFVRYEDIDVIRGFIVDQSSQKRRVVVGEKVEGMKRDELYHPDVVDEIIRTHEPELKKLRRHFENSATSSAV